MRHQVEAPGRQARDWARRAARQGIPGGFRAHEVTGPVGHPPSTSSQIDEDALVLEHVNGNHYHCLARKGRAPGELPLCLTKALAEGPR